MIADTFVHKGYTVEIHYDEGGGAESPRDYCTVGTFVGFRNRNYLIGDEQIDPSEITLDCERCDGGRITLEDVETECSRCDGFGNVYIRTFAQMTEWVKATYDVVGDVYPVSMYEHGGVAYSIGTAAQSGDRWDTSEAGVIFATAKQVEETGVTQTQIPEALKAEIEEYSRWANGEVYGYVIKDRNGDETDDSCWGIIGSEYAEQAAKEAVPDDHPARLIRCRLTDDVLDTIEHALSAAKTTDYIAALVAIRQARPRDPRTDPVTQTQVQVLIIPPCGHRRHVEADAPMDAAARAVEKAKACPDCLHRPSDPDPGRRDG